MTKDRYMYLKLGIILLLQMLILEIFKRYPKIFVLKLVIILSICFIIFAIGFLINHHLAFIGYLLALITVLFFRTEIDKNYSNIDYFNSWINNLFSNKTIFINVFGNLVLYIPFIYYLNLFGNKNSKKYVFINIVIVFGFIIIGEYVQYLLKVGVFDLVDIIINTLGVLIYVLIYEVILWMRKIKIKVKNKMII